MSSQAAIFPRARAAKRAKFAFATPYHCYKDASGPQGKCAKSQACTAHKHHKYCQEVQSMHRSGSLVRNSAIPALDLVVVFRHQVAQG
jgi:hypothetical protein